MSTRQFRTFARPGFTVRNIIAAVLDHGWKEAHEQYEDDISVRRRKGWREVRMTIGAESQKKSAEARLQDRRA